MSDRRKLVHSILDSYPMPSIFLYRREENGIPIYDVLDGKQRLETIFMISRVRPFLRGRFDIRYQLPDDDEYTWDWKSLERWQQTARFLMYKLQVAEVSGELSDIVDLFVRINSTGKVLSSSEKRSARFYKSPLLQESRRLAKRHRRFLADEQLFLKRVLHE